MVRTLDKLPPYLRVYCTEHDTGKYTPRDHAAWRYIMKRALPFFRQHALPGYEEGLQQTGLTVDAIPCIDSIDRHLQKIGWGAVPVVGFIPPWAFLEFQARAILPIATDMRTVDHIAYTPAPDIVHEAAGHAPILPNKEYRDYLQHYAQLGTKAIYSRFDTALYEAIRRLSDIKEKPESRLEDIEAAEAGLEKAIQAFTYVSEQSLVARMSWWTAEYGLLGTPENFKIFGAGLLSSVGESKNLLGPNVKKIPLSLDCIHYSYNITKPQPQLFVARSMQHLSDVIMELDKTLAYRIGGMSSVKKALECEAVSTTLLDSGVGVSGRMTAFEAEGERVDFIKFDGPVQLSRDDEELDDQGIERHPAGFSSPIGRWAQRPDQDPSRFNEGDLRDLGLSIGQAGTIRFVSGFEVHGVLTRVERHEGRIHYMTFEEATVQRQGRRYFEPAWGPFDMVVGCNVVSVHGGPADRASYGEHELAETSTVPGRESPYSPREIALFELYSQIRQLRSHKSPTSADISALEILCQKCLTTYPDEWLLQLEIMDLAINSMKLAPTQHVWLMSVQTSLMRREHSPDIKELIAEGNRAMQLGLT